MNCRSAADRPLRALGLPIAVACRGRIVAKPRRISQRPAFGRRADVALPRLRDVLEAGSNGRLRARLSPRAERRAHAGERVPQDRRRRRARACSKASSAARRSGATAFWRRSRFLLLEAHGKQASSITSTRRRRRDESTPTTRSTCCASGCRRFAWPSCRSCRRSSGGAVGYAGYDTVRYVENLPNAPTDDRDLPDLSFAFYDHMIVFDNVQKTVDRRGAGEGRSTASALAGGLRSAYDDACRRVDRLVEKLSTPTDALPPVDIDTGGDADARRTSRTSRRPSSKTPSASASSTSGPATSFRS